MTSTDARISAENLSKVFGEGEKAIGSGLRELRNNGLTQLKHEVINGNPIKSTFVTELGWKTIADYLRMPSPNSPYAFESSRNPENGVIDSSNEQLSRLILNIYKYKPNTFREDNKVLSSETKTGQAHHVVCTGCYSTPIPLAERVSTEQKKQKEYDDKQSQKHRTAFEKRQGRSLKTWSISDVCMEIAEQAANIWELPPWRFSKSRLVAALTQVRRKWGTDGETEMQAFAFFLKRINVREYPSVDALWQSFIYQFPEILPKVRAMFPTQEDLELAERTKEVSKRKLMEFREMLNSGPSLEQKIAREQQFNRTKQLVHHFKVEEEECLRQRDFDNAKRYKKTYLKLQLDAAILSQNKKEIETLRQCIAEMADIAEIPDGEYTV